MERSVRSIGAAARLVRGLERSALGTLLLAATAWAQTPPVPGDSTSDRDLLRDIRVATRTSPDSLTVGDRVTLEVHVEVPPGTEVHFPEKLAENNKVELIGVQIDPPASRVEGKKTGKSKGKRAQPALTANGAEHWTGRYTLAVFRVGDLVLAPWPVEVQQGARHAVASTDSIRLFVQSVLTDSLAKADLRGLKPQAKLPGPLWPWILAGVALLGLVAGLVFWLRRRRRPRAAVVPIERVRPAHELALDALRKLDARQLPLDGKFVEHHVRLSEILRRYLEDGFGIAALEETSAEILFDLDRHGFDRTTVKQVGSLCAEADAVKFAKHEPTVEDCMRALARVREFVVSTAARSSGATATSRADREPGGAA